MFSNIINKKIIILCIIIYYYIFFDEPRAEDESGYQIIIGKNILQTLHYVCTGICRDGSRVVGNIGVFQEPKEMRSVPMLSRCMGKGINNCNVQLFSRRGSNVINSSAFISSYYHNKHTYVRQNIYNTYL